MTYNVFGGTLSLTQSIKQAAIIFPPDIVRFSILLKEVGFMGRATSRDKSPICLLRSGRARIVEFDMDQTLLSETRSQYMSGRVGSGLVRVRVVEFGL